VIPASDLLLRAIRYSHVTFSEVDVVYNGVVRENNVKVTSASMSTDRGRNTRYEAAVDIALHDWELLPIDSKGTRIRLRQGVSSIGRREGMELGEYQVTDYSRTNRGTVKVTLKGLENIVQEARFIRPRTPPLRGSTLGTIQTLIREAIPDAEFVITASQDQRIQATGAWERERWDAITELANSINVEVWAGWDGKWHIADSPNLSALVPKFRLSGGPGGVLVEETRSDTREGVYNAVVCTAQSSDDQVPPVWAWARDASPASPTYYYGPYGQKPRFYSSQFFTSTYQCQAYADRLLIESLAPNMSLSVGALPVPFLEAGDAATIVSEQGQPTDVFLLQKTALTLGTGKWTAEILSPKPAEDTGA
jgi:hypothetical protein